MNFELRNLSPSSRVRIYSFTRPSEPINDLILQMICHDILMYLSLLGAK